MSVERARALWVKLFGGGCPEGPDCCACVRNRETIERALREERRLALLDARNAVYCERLSISCPSHPGDKGYENAITDCLDAIDRLAALHPSPAAKTGEGR